MLCRIKFLKSTRVGGEKAAVNPPHKLKDLSASRQVHPGQVQNPASRLTRAGAGKVLVPIPLVRLAAEAVWADWVVFLLGVEARVPPEVDGEAVAAGSSGSSFCWLCFTSSSEAARAAYFRLILPGAGRVRQHTLSRHRQFSLLNPALPAHPGQPPSTQARIRGRSGW